MAYLSALDFWGIENPENPYNNLLQAMLQQPGESGQLSGVNTGRDDTTGGYSRGSQFTPPNLTGSSGLPDWLSGPNLAPPWEGGERQPWQITAAENADWIGRGVGALTGLPGMSLIAQALASRYFNNNVFMNPAETTSEMDQAINEMLYGDTPQQSPVLGDTANRQGSSNFSASRMIPGSGSRMNANSAFIWGMPGFGNVQSEPQRINTRIVRDKPGD